MAIRVEERETETDLVEEAGALGAAGDQDEPDPPNSRRRFLPSSIGVTVLLPPAVTEIEARVTWGDYLTEPPLPEQILIGEEIGADGKPKRQALPEVEWVRAPRERIVRLRVPQEGRGDPLVVPESAAAQRKGGGLQLESHARLFHLSSAGWPRRAGSRAHGVPGQSPGDEPAPLCRRDFCLPGAPRIRSPAPRLSASPQTKMKP
jgi:hypothetical protein